MADQPQLNDDALCASADLQDGGEGVLFSVMREGETIPAFVIRHEGAVHAYLNRCRHIPVELDWMPRRFFDDEGVYLVCATHGALYEPASGRCAGGPCSGRGLESVAVEERNGRVYLCESQKAIDDRK